MKKLAQGFSMAGGGGKARSLNSSKPCPTGLHEPSQKHLLETMLSVCVCRRYHTHYVVCRAQNECQLPSLGLYTCVTKSWLFFQLQLWTSSLSTDCWISTPHVQAGEGLPYRTYLIIVMVNVDGVKSHQGNTSLAISIRDYLD